MSMFSNEQFGAPSSWVEKKRMKKTPWTWDQIRTINGKTEEEVLAFLSSHELDDDWPPFSIELWNEFIDMYEADEQNQLDIEFRGTMGALFDKTQGNDLEIPLHPKSSWQLYKNSLSWDPDSIKQLEYATFGILRRLSIDTRGKAPIKGLVVGYVQSGKTANMEGLMAMTADYGWNMFIVLSGTIENLRKQTSRRMVKDLNHHGNLHWQELEHLSKSVSYGLRPANLDFSKDSTTRYFTVCLKNKKRLEDLIEWLHWDSNVHNNMRVLIIDDEADQASISNNAHEYGEEQEERKGINKLITCLVRDEYYKETSKKLGKAASINYVMYTATPYANFLNESTEESLYPSDFIWTLIPSSQYIGPKQIFGTSQEEGNEGIDIKRTVSLEDLRIIEEICEDKTTEVPNSLKTAILWFICAVSVMRFWGYKKPISMLVHTSQRQAAHEKVAKRIQYWLESAIKKEEIIALCKEVYIYETNRLTKDMWYKQIKKYGMPYDQIKDYPAFIELQPIIKELLNAGMSHIKMSEEGDLEYHKGIHLVIDNCSKNGINEDNEHVRLAYPDENASNYPSPAPAFIVVGGSTLSRGLTIEGLVSTFFLRSSCQADTLMQMGRWFGFRKGYELLPRIWMTRDTQDKFQFLSYLEEELRVDLKKYMTTELSPRDYGPRVLCSPKVSWLRATSRVHSANAVPAEMDFTGAKPQTTIFDGDVKIQQENIEITESFINSLNCKWEVSSNGASLFANNVPLKTIMDNYLIEKFHFSNRSRVFNEIGMFCDWIKDVAKENQLDNWTVIIAGKGQVDSNGIANPWIVAGHSIGKVNRSRKWPRSEFDSTIDIGVLRSIGDLVSDVPEKIVKEYKEDRKIQTITKQGEVDEIREKSGLNNVPLLLIYRINKDSKARESAIEAEERQDLRFGTDIIGIQIYIPGSQINKDYRKALTVFLPEKDEEIEVEEEL